MMKFANEAQRRAVFANMNQFSSGSFPSNDVLFTRPKYVYTEGYDNPEIQKNSFAKYAWEVDDDEDKPRRLYAWEKPPPTEEETRKKNLEWRRKQLKDMIEIKEGLIATYTKVIDMPSDRLNDETREKVEKELEKYKTQLESYKAELEGLPAFAKDPKKGGFFPDPQLGEDDAKNLDTIRKGGMVYVSAPDSEEEFKKYDDEMRKRLDKKKFAKKTYAEELMEEFMKAGFTKDEAELMIELSKRDAEAKIDDANRKRAALKQMLAEDRDL